MWLFIGTFALAFLAALMLVWLDDRSPKRLTPGWTLTSSRSAAAGAPPKAAHSRDKQQGGR
ncbi:hypothetical protein MJ561_25065 [Klebsiella pneumoniae]|nr:hypothetical protein MJ561_25065 [Klebsiella pneumoniae]